MGKAERPSSSKLEKKVAAKLAAKLGRMPTAAEVAKRVEKRKKKKDDEGKDEGSSKKKAVVGEEDEEKKKKKKKKKKTTTTTTKAHEKGRASPSSSALFEAFALEHNVRATLNGADASGRVASTVVLDLDKAGDLLGEEVLGKLRGAGFVKPTPIQSLAWPLALDGAQDLVAIAKTGSGKTLAFMLPALRRDTAVPGAITVVVLAPTRELAQQIAKDAAKFAPADKSIACVYGGEPREKQKALLRKKPLALVATPGRLEDFLNAGDVDLSHVTCCVLDEADRMLDMGFEPQLKAIVGALTAPTRQTLFFSATWPPAVRQLAERYAVHTPLIVSVGADVDKNGDLEASARANKAVAQAFQKLDDSEKDAALVQVIDSMADSDRMICFTNTKRRVDYLHKSLWAEGYGSSSIHGGRTQKEREEALRKFESGEWPLMFATDVAARGLDLPDVSIVVNFDMPRDVEQYIHRIGRTGRAGKSGRAVTFWNVQYDLECAAALAKIARDADQLVPTWLDDAGKQSKVGKNWKL